MLEVKQGDRGKPSFILPVYPEKVQWATLSSDLVVNQIILAATDRRSVGLVDHLAGND
ncbi:hypothetical protein D3C71_1829790 [compost metagenome]